MRRQTWQPVGISAEFPILLSLGVLAGLAANLKTPVGVVVSYALFAVLTALRFRSLEWKVAKAFIPLAIVVGATLLGSVLGPSMVAAAHRVAFFAQVFISLCAALSFGPHDPLSPKRRLARDFLAKRFQLSRTLKENKPLREAHQREVAKLSAINSELQASVATHGFEKTEQYKDILARFDAQCAVVEPLAAASKAASERLRAQSNDFKQVWEEWKNRKQRLTG